VLALIGLSANAAAASVTITMFPAGSVIIGRVLFRDAVTRAQVIGLAIVIAGTIAIVVG
jgi:multidrug transporter EmrE-like cation transporter